MSAPEQSGVTVPYVQLWSGEQKLPAPLVRHVGPKGAFLGYEDEIPHDRDGGGALWARYSLAQGKGTASFTSLHPLRQRRAVTRGLCQVCATQLPTDHAADPPLFLLQSAGGRPVQEGEHTQAAPVCELCARKALRDCPPLRRGAVAARVKYPIPWGVSGIVYDLDTLLPLHKNRIEVSYFSDAIRQVLAYRTVLALHGVTPVDMRTLMDTSEPARP